MKTKRNPDLTRETLLQAAFQEIYKNGFQAASLDQIIANTGVTKGALYHHFPNKQALGHAVLDEVIRGMIIDKWLRPFTGSDDPVGVIHGILDWGLKMAKDDPYHLTHGCPMNNIAQEMSPLDEGFRMRIEKLYRLWRDGFAEAFERGQKAGTVRKDIDATVVASFVISALEGCLGTAKVAQDWHVLETNLQGLRMYIDTLREPVETH